MFTYKGESQFSTSFGGFISLAMLAAVSVYMTIQVQTMMSRSSANNTLSTSVINLNIEDSNKTLVNYGFAFGVSVTDTNGRPLTLDPTYFTLDISQVTTKKVSGYYDFVYTSLGYKLCDSNDLPGLSAEYIQRGLSSSLYCPVNKQYNVAGNYLANNYQYVSVTLSKWTVGACKPTALINAALQGVVLSLVVKNNYMDFSDYVTPVKSYVDDRNFFIWLQLQQKYEEYILSKMKLI